MSEKPYQISGGRWLVTGTLPNDCKLIEREGEQVFTDAVGNPQPECFGVFWEAIGPEADTENCRDCDLEPMCRLATVNFRVPQVLREIGEATVEALAPQMELNHEATAALLGDHCQLTVPHGVQPKRPKRAPPPAGEGQIGPLPDVTGGPPANPMFAPSAQIVLDGATQTAAKKISAQLARVWDVHRRIWIRPWEAHLQWKRERVANEWIRQLLPGMILRRSYAGKWWTVQVHKHAYQFQGCLYPTLTAITVEICQKVPARQRMRWQTTQYPSHVARFWCLPKLLLENVERQKAAMAAKEISQRFRSRFWPE